MKAKRITHRNQLVGGQFYIRALANCHGRVWFDVIQVAGQPFKYKDETASSLLRDSFQIIQISRRYGWDKGKNRREYFTSDLGADHGGHRQKTLYPFSNKLALHLTELSKDKRKFCEFIDNKQYTDKEWAELQHDWEWQAYMDRQFDRLMREEYNREYNEVDANGV